MCRSDNVDDRFGICGVFCRWISDGLDAGNSVGGQGLKIGLEVFFGEFRRLVVNPDFHARNATQSNIAFHIDFYTRRILQSILCCASLNGWVFTDVVDKFFAVHGVNRFLGSDGDLIKRRGSWSKTQRPQVGVVLNVERLHEILVTNSRDTQQERTLWHLVDLETPVKVTNATFYEGGVNGIENSNIDVWEKFAIAGIAQNAYYGKGVAYTYFLFLFDRHIALLRVPFTVTVTHRRTTGRSAARRSPSRRRTATRELSFTNYRR